MDVTPLVRSGQQIIQSYKGGGFRVSGEVYSGAVIVLPSKTQLWAAAMPLTLSHFQPLTAMAGDIDVLLIGTGASMVMIPSVLRQQLKEERLIADIMDTGAACRTYNVLMAEGRRVAAALLPV